MFLFLTLRMYVTRQINILLSMSYFMARFIRLFLFFYTKNVKISPSHYVFDHNQLTACSCLSSCCFSQDELTMVQRSIIELKKNQWQ